MKLPKLIKECEWVQRLRPIEPDIDPDVIERSYLVPGFKEAGLKIAEALINAGLDKPHRMRVSIQVVAEEIAE